MIFGQDTFGTKFGDTAISSYKDKIFLEKLYIHNFKSFYSSEFEFSKLNCLIAPNNTGKSNLIEVLEFLDSLIYENVARAIAKVGLKDISNYHYKDKDDLSINALFNIKSGRVLTFTDKAAQGTQGA